MSLQHRWVLGLAAGAGALGIAATSSLIILSQHFIEELSRPHNPLDAENFTWTLPNPEPEPPASQRRSILFHTTDGTRLSGDFWAQPQPAPTIIICHGYRVNRTVLRPVAALEYKYGYNILLFDFRGHGESESIATSGGNALLDPQPDVAAIIVDSPYARLDEILKRIVHWQLTNGSTSWAPFMHPLRNGFHALTWITMAIGSIVFRLRFGHALNARPATSFKRWQVRSKGIIHQSYPPILLIHGVKDNAIPITHAHQIVTQAYAHNITLQTYFVEDAEHCGAYGNDPQKYIQVLERFITQYLS